VCSPSAIAADSRSTTSVGSCARVAGVSIALSTASAFSPLTSSAMRAFNAAPSSATPTAPPIVRENCVDDVTAPRSDHGTAFCGASRNAVLTLPNPVPASAIPNISTGSGVSRVTKNSGAMPSAVHVAPSSAVAR